MTTPDLVSLQTIEQDLTCPVCLTVFRKPKKLFLCKHTFCKQCIGRLENKKCPLCRRTFYSITVLDNTSLAKKIKHAKFECADCAQIFSASHYDDHCVECPSRVAARQRRKPVPTTEADNPAGLAFSDPAAAVAAAMAGHPDTANVIASLWLVSVGLLLMLIVSNVSILFLEVLYTTAWLLREILAQFLYTIELLGHLFGLLALVLTTTFQLVSGLVRLLVNANSLLIGLVLDPASLGDVLRTMWNTLAAAIGLV